MELEAVSTTFSFINKVQFPHFSFPFIHALTYYIFSAITFPPMKSCRVLVAGVHISGLFFLVSSFFMCVSLIQEGKLKQITPVNH